MWEELPALADIASRDENGVELPGRDLFSMVLTKAGAAVHHACKNAGVLVDSSMAAEQIATSKIAEIVDYARTVDRAINSGSKSPTRIGTDNKANMQAAMRRGGSNRCRHLLRRYFVLRQRIAAGECRVVHVPDAENPSDFLTKWLPAAKLRRSLAYVCGTKNKLAGISKPQSKKSAT